MARLRTVAGATGTLWPSHDARNNLATAAARRFVNRNFPDDSHSPVLINTALQRGAPKGPRMKPFKRLIGAVCVKHLAKARGVNEMAG